MNRRRKSNARTVPFILLTAIGISSFGAWIYLIALNLIVLAMTQSPLAVAGLYIIKPLAALIANGWAGSVIDRTPKRSLMIRLDLFRAALVLALPFISSLWGIYLVVLFVSMAGAISDPASMAYITKLIPEGKRQRFNAVRALLDSGAFLIGPAIAGLLFMIGTPTAALFINSAALLFSGLLLFCLPNIEKEEAESDFSPSRLSWSIVRQDWEKVLHFTRQTRRVVLIIALFSFMGAMMASIDSQEAAFAKHVLQLSNDEYGFLVSVAGGGILTGALVNVVLSHKWQALQLIGGSSLVVAAGYFIYATSHTFTGAAIGFFILAFALAFANTGFQTFVQNNVPADMMGRMLSAVGMAEAAFVILLTLIIGISAELNTIRSVVVSAVLVMLVPVLLLKVLTMDLASFGKMKKETSA